MPQSLHAAALFGPFLGQTPIGGITGLVRFLGADLRVLHTYSQPYTQDERQTGGGQWLKEQPTPLQPRFHWQQDADVLHGITDFLSSHDIDCLIVVPRKYNIWESLFLPEPYKSLSKAEQNSRAGFSYTGCLVVAFRQSEIFDRRMV